MNPTLIERLQQSANKLRHLWGQNDDSNSIEEAIKILVQQETAVAAEKPTRKSKGV